MKYNRYRSHSPLNGLTPAQIIELASVVGFWKLYNTIHLSLKVPLEANLHNVSDKIQL